MATLRGHSGQITDISIDRSNQYIASGSLDKVLYKLNFMKKIKEILSLGVDSSLG